MRKEELRAVNQHIARRNCTALERWSQCASHHTDTRLPSIPVDSCRFGFERARRRLPHAGHGVTGLRACAVQGRVGELWPKCARLYKQLRRPCVPHGNQVRSSRSISSFVQATASSTVGRTESEPRCSSYRESQFSPLVTCGGHDCIRRYVKSLLQTSAVFTMSMEKAPTSSCRSIRSLARSLPAADTP